MCDTDALISHRFATINENLISALIKSQLYFASPQAFNDPYDCRIDIEKSLARARAEANVSQREVLQVYTCKLLAEIVKKTEEVGVVCLSKELDNALMWSHYAKAHTGLCLTYEVPSIFIRENSPQILGWGEVQYENNQIKDFFLTLRVCYDL